MAFNFTFADNQRLGLQIVGANSTGTSEQPIGFKRVVVDNDNNVAGEVMYIGQGENSTYKLGLGGGFYINDKGVATAKSAAGAPIFGVYIKDGNGDYIQTGGVAYVHTDAALTKEAKVYLITSSGKISSSSSGGVEIKGAIAGDPANKISVMISGSKTDLYPIYLNNATL